MQASSAVENNDAMVAIEGRLVRHIDDLDWIERGNASWACAFGGRHGADRLALYVLKLHGSLDKPLNLGGRETVMHVLSGSGTVTLGDEPRGIEAGDGIHVREFEAFSFETDSALTLLVAVCPAGDLVPWESAPTGPAGFDEDYPDRVFPSSSAPSEKTGERSFKVLIGRRTGSNAVTQFIGSIPRSRAPEHFHHYEEVICVLSGEGTMWMGQQSAPVRPGSLVFLPRKQPHCMECTVPEGMQLLGMFYPAGSPAVNYKTQEEE